MSTESTPRRARVRAVNLPRYEVEYLTREYAFMDAQRMRRGEPLRIPDRLREPPGSQAVMDLRATGLTTSAVFLFRLLQVIDDDTVVEWIPRRRTDPGLLELWTAGLETRTEPPRPDAQKRSSIDQIDQQQLLEVCRRLRSPNPFIALNVHWAARHDEIRQVQMRLRRVLETCGGIDGLHPRLAAELGPSMGLLDLSADTLSTLEGRREARARFIAGHQLRAALELARTKLEIARLRGDHRAAEEHREEIAELTVQTE